MSGNSNEDEIKDLVENQSSAEEEEEEEYPDGQSDQSDRFSDNQSGNQSENGGRDWSENRSKNEKYDRSKYETEKLANTSQNAEGRKSENEALGKKSTNVQVGKPSMVSGRSLTMTSGRKTGVSGVKSHGRHTQATLGLRQTMGSDLMKEWELYGDYELDGEETPPAWRHRHVRRKNTKCNFYYFYRLKEWRYPRHFFALFSFMTMMNIIIICFSIAFIIFIETRKDKVDFKQNLYVKTKGFDDKIGEQVESSSVNVPESEKKSETVNDNIIPLLACWFGLLMGSIGFLTIFHLRVNYMGYTFVANVLVVIVLVEMIGSSDEVHFRQRLETFLVDLFLVNRDWKGYLPDDIQEKFQCCGVHGAAEYVCLGILDKMCNPKRRYAQCSSNKTGADNPDQIFAGVILQEDESLTMNYPELKLPGCTGLVSKEFFGELNKGTMYMLWTLLVFALMGFLVGWVAYVEWRYLVPDLTIAQYITKKCCDPAGHAVDTAAHRERLKEEAMRIRNAIEAARIAREEELRRIVEEKKRAEEDERARREAEEKARREAEEKARLEAEMARLEAERMAAMNAEQKRLLEIRQKLKAAIVSRDKKELLMRTQDFRRNKLDDKDGDLARAERILKALHIETDLIKAVETKDVEECKRLMKIISRDQLSEELDPELVRKAQFLVEREAKLAEAMASILAMNQATIAELKSYQKPPYPVHDCMMGMLLLLGNKEKDLKKWDQVKVALNKTGKEAVKRQVKELSPPQIDKDAAKRAWALVKDIDVIDVVHVSLGAATFLVWTQTMCSYRLDVV